MAEFVIILVNKLMLRLWENFKGNFMDKLCSKRNNFRPRIGPNYGGICGDFVNKLMLRLWENFKGPQS